MISDTYITSLYKKAKFQDIFVTDVTFRWFDNPLSNVFFSFNELCSNVTAYGCTPDIKGLKHIFRNLKFDIDQLAV